MNQRGMTLISAMMSVSVSAIAMVTTFKLVDMAVEVFATLQGTVRAIDTVHEIRFAIGQSKICTLNFNDVVLSTAPVAVTRKLYYPDPTDNSQKSALEIGAIDTEGTIVSIVELTLRREPGSLNLAYLDIDMNRTKGAGSLPLRKRTIPMLVHTDAANKITCCSTMEVDQCAEDINVFSPPGCTGGLCACGPTLGGFDCGEPPPASSDKICVAKGYARSTTATVRPLTGGETICNPDGTNCRSAPAICSVCEVVTCEN